jgi:hypothetical protein
MARCPLFARVAMGTASVTPGSFFDSGVTFIIAITEMTSTRPGA